MNRRRNVLMAVLLALLCVILLSSYRYMSACRASAVSGAEDLNECRSMAYRIEGFSQRPALASEQERVSGETTGLIERAAKSARISPESLVRITPEPAQRVGETVYKDKPTHVLLKKVTMKQLVALAHGLVSAEQSLHPKSIRVAAPRVNDAGNLWTAEIVLTYLIYEPPHVNK